MPTRKQRRRRQKDRRHEYEYVYVDEEGREVDVDPEDREEAAPRRNGKRDPKRAPAKGGSRPARAVQPPSWSRVGKRALIFFPLIFLAFSFINSNQAFVTRLLLAFVYTGFFVPFMYVMDRAMYRSYLKRSGQPLPRREPRKR